MSLAKRIEDDFLVAYKAREDVRVAVLRMLKTAAKNRQVELGRELSDDELREVMAKLVKQRLESIEYFRQGGRQELADKEQAEIDILRAYLPAALTPEETAQAVEAAVAEVQASGMKDMGRVMQVLMRDYKDRLDGKLASGLVKSRLSA
jgi:uncharacterized protein YqeY